MGVLIRFRKEPIAVVADIEAIFHQVFVGTNDRDVLRFLLWPHNDLTKEQEDYQMQVHIFGATSSPSCTSFCLKKTAKDKREKFVAETIKRDASVVDIDCEQQPLEETVGIPWNVER